MNGASTTSTAAATAPATTTFKPLIIDAGRVSEIPAIGRSDAAPDHGRDSWVEKLNAKTAESVTLSKGTLWLLGLLVVVANLVFLYGGSMFAWVRDDQTQKEQIGVMQMNLNETRNEVKELNRKFDAIQLVLQEQAVRDARTQGYTLGQTDAGATGHKNK